MICGRKEYLDNAHVKDESDFPPGEDDEWKNIIPLCPSHHRMFDRQKIGICPSKNHFIIAKEVGMELVSPEESIHHIKDEYVRYHNRKCGPRLRCALGLIPGQEYAKMCD